MRAGKGIPGRGYSSCKGPEVGKSTENARDKESWCSCIKHALEGAGRGQILHGPVAMGRILS